MKMKDEIERQRELREMAEYSPTLPTLVGTHRRYTMAKRRPVLPHLKDSDSSSTFSLRAACICLICCSVISFSLQCECEYSEYIKGSYRDGCPYQTC